MLPLHTHMLVRTYYIYRWRIQLWLVCEQQYHDCWWLRGVSCIPALLWDANTGQHWAKVPTEGRPFPISARNNNKNWSILHTESLHSRCTQNGHSPKVEYSMSVSLSFAPTTLLAVLSTQAHPRPDNKEPTSSLQLATCSSQQFRFQRGPFLPWSDPKQMHRVFFLPWSDPKRMPRVHFLPWSDPKRMQSLLRAMKASQSTKSVTKTKHSKMPPSSKATLLRGKKRCPAFFRSVHGNTEVADLRCSASQLAASPASSPKGPKSGLPLNN